MNYIDAVKFLLSRCIHVNQQDNLGNTALHYAVKYKNIHIIYELVNQEADIDLKNNENESAWEIAQKSKDKIIIKALSGDLQLSEIKNDISFHPTITSQLKEYLYIGTSNLYITIERNDERQIEINEAYKAFINEVLYKMRQEKPSYNALINEMCFPYK
ncbi:ankyrin [Piromyces finnis]|uniref:Ankyrin n=1 Tax=Piromyces finnis TaxID=1754191 RepID=A0A1Y1V5T0_9FUNG|nr:ankyrin [Piromyces finnis]|eukprot:ORX47095.1 ankyrin [Piromyces finnis]